MTLFANKTLKSALITGLCIAALPLFIMAV